MCKEMTYEKWQFVVYLFKPSMYLFDFILFFVLLFSDGSVTCHYQARKNWENKVSGRDRNGYMSEGKLDVE